MKTTIKTEWVGEAWFNHRWREWEREKSRTEAGYQLKHHQLYQTEKIFRLVRETAKITRKVVK